MRVDPEQPLEKAEEMFAAMVALLDYDPLKAYLDANLPLAKRESTNRSRAEKLLATERVRARVTFFRANRIEHERKQRLESGAPAPGDLRTDDVVGGLLGLATDKNQKGRDRVAAWAHLGRYLGMFTDNVTVNLPKPIEQLSDAELHALAASAQRGKPN